MTERELYNALRWSMKNENDHDLMKAEDEYAKDAWFWQQNQILAGRYIDAGGMAEA